MSQIEHLKRKDEGLEDQLQVAVAGCEAGRRDTALKQHGSSQCLVLGDSIIRNVKTEHMSVQCFLSFINEQLKRVVENRKLGKPDTILIHLGTKDLRRSVNVHYDSGEV
jgi:tRNA A37 methylthiotransferase MiaB